MNTCWSYLYRDASNYKIHQDVVTAGPLPADAVAAVFRSLDDGEYFIPDNVGFPAPRPEEEDPLIDHPWYELRDVEATEEEPTLEITTEQAVRAFKECKNNWCPPDLWA